ncbi:hypothetical protein PS1_035124 [Malus domestica]
MGLNQVTLLSVATSSTPGLFKPFSLRSVDEKTSCSAVDDGLVMNNLTVAAVTHVLNNKRDFPSVNGSILGQQAITQRAQWPMPCIFFAGW